MKIGETIKKSLFFIGAGASMDAGCKTSIQMLDALKDEICSASNTYFTFAENEAIKFLFSCLEYHSEWRSLETGNKYQIKPNIEELALLIRRIKNRDNYLPYPVTGNWADKLTTLESTFYKDTRQNLFDTLEYTLKNKLLPLWLTVANTDYLIPLDDFFRSNSDSNFTMELFSLNNDMVFEQHYSQQKAKPYRGFYSGEWRGFRTPTNREECNRINLYKLHGSLDWVRLNDGSVIEEKKAMEIEAEERESRIEHEKYIIFGHGTKFFSVEPFFSLIQKFRDSLDHCSYFFVLGYSFFDPYINNLFFQAVKDANDENKKIIIINPGFAEPPLSEEYFDKNSEYGLILNEQNSEGKRLLTDFLEGIQRNAFYSELPEFNIKQISAESIFFIKMNTADFLKKYFSESGKLLNSLIDKFESERKEGLPF